MSQGAYRIHGPEGDLVEAFVAAPGPAGWRWFGRVHDPETGEERYVVDHVVNAEWRLVRFRLLDRASGEFRVEPSGTGLTVTEGGHVDNVPGAEMVWSPSPASLVVLDHYLQATGTSRARGVGVTTSGAWGPVTVALEDRGTLVVNGERRPVTWAEEEPARAEGWFELLPEGQPLRP